MRYSISRRRLGFLIGAAGAAVVTRTAARSQARPWPTKPIRIIESFPAGVARDPMTRVLADKLSTVLGERVFVENRPGAAGRVAGEEASHASPDGYTFWMAGVGDVAVAKYLYKVPYDVDRAFTPVVLAWVAPAALIVRPTLPARTLPEFVSYAKQHPGELTYGSSGAGQFLHLNGLLLAKTAGIDLRHVPYSQGSPFNDLLGGHIDMVIDALNSSIENIKAGRLRTLAVTGNHRLAILPDVPTFAEAGLPNYDTQGCAGLLAPTGTPGAIKSRMQMAVDEVLKDQALRQQWEALGYVLVGGTAEQFTAWIRIQSNRWGEIIHENNLKIN